MCVFCSLGIIATAALRFAVLQRGTSRESVSASPLSLSISLCGTICDERRKVVTLDEAAQQKGSLGNKSQGPVVVRQPTEGGGLAASRMTRSPRARLCQEMRSRNMQVTHTHVIIWHFWGVAVNNIDVRSFLLRLCVAAEVRRCIKLGHRKASLEADA